MIALMYHSIVASDTILPPDRETGADLYDLPLANFIEHMKWLKASGKEAYITFDDGEMNNYQAAFPVLKELGLKGYFFIIVKRVGKPGYMGWNEIEELIKGGMEIGSHGLTHAILTNLKDSQIEEELRASKKAMEANLNKPIKTLSIPRGFCDDNVIEKAYQLGYQTIFISQRPKCLKAQCISRVAVKSGWSLKRFKMAVEGKKPIAENIVDGSIKFAKFILRESGYNFIRSLLIKVFR